QARQSAQPSSTYAAVNANADIALASNLNGDEVIAALTGSATPTGNFAPQPINLSFTSDPETLGQTVGATFTADADVAALTSNRTLDLTITAKNGVSKTASIALDFSTITTKAGLLTAINNAVTSGGGTVGNYVTASYDASNKLVLTANSADV